MQMKTTMRYHLTLVRMAILKRPQVRSVAEDSEERESLCTCCRNANWCNHRGKQQGFPQKIRNRTTMWWASPLLSVYTKEMGTEYWREYLYSHVHCSIHNGTVIWKQLKCPSVNEWINQMWYTHIHTHTHASQVALVVKNLVASAGDIRDQSLDQEDPLEKTMATHSSVLA